MIGSRLALLALLGLTACAGRIPVFESAYDHAADVAAAAGFAPTADRAGGFVTRGFANGRTGALITIYLEGDGQAYVQGQPRRRDPSPKDPNALRLAILDPYAGPKAYLARPCQYPFPGDPPCAPNFWLTSRFSEPVVAAVDAAVTAAKRRAQAERIRLVGYSGGGAVALLVAARRDDVERVVTVAGTLDHAAWTEAHGYWPLDGRPSFSGDPPGPPSLNPPAFVDRLGPIRQVHFVGGDDAEILPAVAASFMRRKPADARWLMEILPGVDHGDSRHPDDWAERWPSLAIAAGLAR